MKYIFKKDFVVSIKVGLLALLFAPFILLFLNFFVLKTEEIESSSFFALLILSGVQNIVFIIVLLLVGKFFYYRICKLFSYTNFILCNFLYYLFLVLIFPLQSCIVFKCGFYKETYPIVLISVLVLADIFMRYIKYKKEIPQSSARL